MEPSAISTYTYYSRLDHDETRRSRALLQRRRRRRQPVGLPGDPDGRGPRRRRLGPRGGPPFFFSRGGPGQRRTWLCGEAAWRDARCGLSSSDWPARFNRGRRRTAKLHGAMRDVDYRRAAGWPVSTAALGCRARGEGEARTDEQGASRLFSILFCFGAGDSIQSGQECFDRISLAIGVQFH